MKSIGVVRRIDDLGRVVIPMELRRTMGIEPGCPLEMFTDGDSIILKKYSRGCQACGSMENLETVLGITLCLECCKKLVVKFRYAKV